MFCNRIITRLILLFLLLGATHLSLADAQSSQVTKNVYGGDVAQFGAYVSGHYFFGNRNSQSIAVLDASKEGFSGYKDAIKLDETPTSMYAWGELLVVISHNKFMAYAYEQDSLNLVYLLEVGGMPQLGQPKVSDRYFAVLSQSQRLHVLENTGAAVTTKKKLSLGMPSTLEELKYYNFEIANDQLILHSIGQSTNMLSYVHAIHSFTLSDADVTQVKMVSSLSSRDFVESHVALGNGRFAFSNRYQHITQIEQRNSDELSVERQTLDDIYGPVLAVNNNTLVVLGRFGKYQAYHLTNGKLGSIHQDDIDNNTLRFSDTEIGAPINNGVVFIGKDGIFTFDIASANVFNVSELAYFGGEQGKPLIRENQIFQPTTAGLNLYDGVSEGRLVFKSQTKLANSDNKDRFVSLIEHKNRLFSVGQHIRSYSRNTPPFEEVARAEIADYSVDHMVNGDYLYLLYAFGKVAAYDISSVDSIVNTPSISEAFSLEPLSHEPVKLCSQNNKLYSISRFHEDSLIQYVHQGNSIEANVLSFKEVISEGEWVRQASCNENYIYLASNLGVLVLEVGESNTLSLKHRLDLTWGAEFIHANSEQLFVGTPEPISAYMHANVYDIENTEPKFIEQVIFKGLESWFRIDRVHAKSDLFMVFPPDSANIITATRNTPPALSQTEYSLKSNESVTISLDELDTDGNRVTVMIDESPNTGVLIYNSLTNSLEYTPKAMQSALDEATITLTDSAGAKATYELVFNVQRYLEKPILTKTEYFILKNTKLVVQLTPEDDTSSEFTYTIFESAKQGLFNVDADGVLTYQPDKDFVGEDKVRITITNSLQSAESYVLTFKVRAENAAPIVNQDIIEMVEDEPFTIDLSVSDEEAHRVTYSISQFSNNLSDVKIDESGKLTISPALDAFGDGSVVVKLEDEYGAVSETTIRIKIEGKNDAPSTEIKQVVGEEGAVLSSTLPSTDVDGDKLTYSLQNTTTNGSITLSQDGTFNYTPNAGYTGNDSFTYNVADASGLSSTGKVTITVKTKANTSVSGQNAANGKDGGGGSINVWLIMLAIVGCVLRIREGSRLNRGR
ncbi:Ig-like domain-containing protein [Aestuariibacter sp. AA17]|uniref:Ig-like domain-containing protein n=1 Tax=Fluctibacter corallii TaxID=2984329 RepID=A0ABT3A7V1_9ALTE|nr:Ig-like domain-containing protein [Aestuariibacter sp. AA17]MCV2884757.1 Ig-like domain-containing protein [Aestuariibacter sp. AA17]